MNNNSLMHIKGQASHVNFLLQISIFCQKFFLCLFTASLKSWSLYINTFHRGKTKDKQEKTLLLVFDSGYKQFS